MSATTAAATTIHAARRPKRRRIWLRTVAIIVVLVAATAGGSLWALGYRPGKGFTGGKETYATVEIGRGDVWVTVLESGSLESADNAMIKCQVEALLGTIGTAQPGINGQGGGGGGGRGNAGGQNAQAAPAQAAPAAPAAGARAGAGAGGARAGAAPAGRAGAAMSSVGAGAAGGGGSGVARPMVQSFTMQVMAHVPLRPRAVANQGGAAAKAAMAGGMGGGPGGRGGGGGGGRGGQQQGMGADRQGSTRIISLVPEGTLVSSGDVVCELDSAALRDELQSQSIRWEQAQSWVNQAREILKVARISYQEYKEGIYPQDLQQVEKYIEICETQLKQASDLVSYDRKLALKSMLGVSQVRAAEYAEERSQIGLVEAKGMRRRLIEFTGPRLLKNLEAKISAVQADLLAQESSFQLEDDRRRKLQRMIDLCILRAPRDGMVAYASESGGPGWSPTSTLMAEGVTVRQGQTIILLPDPRRMRAKVRVNESKMSLVFPGQRTSIRIEAFPDQPLTGMVTEITPIPAPASMGSSDVKLYYANVAIDPGGFEGLRTGLSAQVAFQVDRRLDVTRIPVDAIRWSDGHPFAAIPRADRQGFDWKMIELGLVGANVAEVKAGLKPGDRVIAKPEFLPAPDSGSKRISGPMAIGFDGKRAGL